MKNILLPLFLASSLLLTGCATQGSYGNFSQMEATQNQDFLVTDAMKQMVLLYPPAHTRLALQHNPTDHFGLSLVTNLRARGYAVVEYAEELKAAESNANAFSYLVDTVDSNLDRVTLNIGKKSINRAYLLTPTGDYSPAGDWSKKE